MDFVSNDALHKLANAVRRTYTDRPVEVTDLSNDGGSIEATVADSAGNKTTYHLETLSDATDTALTKGLQDMLGPKPQTKPSKKGAKVDA